ncbi:MAG: hypothetical protein ACREFQ_20375, partial [Stellaceae bacterium]
MNLAIVSPPAGRAIERGGRAAVKPPPAARPAAFSDRRASWYDPGHSRLRRAAKDNAMGIDLGSLLDDRPEDGVFRVHADAFRRRDVFDLEMQHIYEASWVYVGLECQVPNLHD